MITAFQLLTYSCVVVNFMDGTLASRICRWDGGGTSALYETLSRCEQDGRDLIGKPIFSDVADGRKIENYKCTRTSIDIKR